MLSVSRAAITTQVHAQPLICFQFADNEVVYFLVWVQLQIKLSPCNRLALSLPLVIRSSEQRFELTCTHACAVRECYGPEKTIFVSFKTASQFPTNMVDYGVCNMPSLDFEQSPGTTRIERPLAGGLEKAAGTAKARAKQRQGSDRFSSCIQQLNEIRNWSLGTGVRGCICIQGHLCPPQLQQRGCYASSCYFLQGLEPLWDLRDTAKCLVFLPHEHWEWGWI